ncbi:hypothetical protein [Streptomyces tubercidicus]
MAKRRCTAGFDAPERGGSARQAQSLTSTQTIAAKTTSSSKQLE